MDNIKVTTTQNVVLEYEAAGVGYRILAALLDSVFMAVYVGVMLLIFGLGFARTNFFKNDPDQYLLIGLLILLSLPITLYHFLSETLMNGQSLGKKVLGIKVVKLDGTQAGIGSYFLRSIMRIIDMQISNGVVALISIAVTDKSQRIGDMAAGTTVIKLGSNVTLRDTILYKKIDEYKIVFEQVSLLNDKDIDIIKDILQHSIQNNKLNNLQVLSLKVKTKMGVESSLSHKEFLQTVLLDYSHYQFEK